MGASNRRDLSEVRPLFAVALVMSCCRWGVRPRDSGALGDSRAGGVIPRPRVVPAPIAPGDVCGHRHASSHRVAARPAFRRRRRPMTQRGSVVSWVDVGGTIPPADVARRFLADRSEGKARPRNRRPPRLAEMGDALDWPIGTTSGWDAARAGRTSMRARSEAGSMTSWHAMRRGTMWPRSCLRRVARPLHMGSQTRRGGERGEHRRSGRRQRRRQLDPQVPRKTPRTLPAPLRARCLACSFPVRSVPRSQDGEILTQGDFSTLCAQSSLASRSPKAHRSRATDAGRVKRVGRGAIWTTLRRASRRRLWTSRPSRRPKPSTLDGTNLGDVETTCAGRARPMGDRAEQSLVFACGRESNVGTLSRARVRQSRRRSAPVESTGRSRSAGRPRGRLRRGWVRHETPRTNHRGHRGLRGRRRVIGRCFRKRRTPEAKLWERFRVDAPRASKSCSTPLLRLTQLDGIVQETG